MGPSGAAPHIKQIRGAGPAASVPVGLSAVASSGGVSWAYDTLDGAPAHQPGLCVGLQVADDGLIAFSPSFVPRRRAGERIVVGFDFTGQRGPAGRWAECALAILYRDRAGVLHKTSSEPLTVEAGRFEFVLPVEEFGNDDVMFSCSVHVTLMDRTLPVLVLGAWVAVR